MRLYIAIYVWCHYPHCTNLAGRNEIFIIPTPTIADIEGNDIQFACSPLNTAAPPVLQINGTTVTPSSGMRLTAEDFPDANRTYTFRNIQRTEDGTTFQCFTADLLLASNITTLIVYCKP